MFFSRRIFHVVAVLSFALLLFGCSDSSTPTSPDSDDSTVQFDSEAPPGNAARAFLNDRDFTVLNLEIDFMEGYEPTEAALDSLQTSLETHLSKSSIHLGPPNSIPAQNQNSYSAQEIRDLEEEHRDHYTRAQSDTLWAYFIIVDGEFADQNVLGIAYYNTSMAFFGKKIDEITGDVTQPSREKVEATVFRHEFGHNLGLVNNGIPMQQNHQDEDNGHHCTNEECLMYYAIETSDYFSNVFDGTIPEFEHFCTEDMAAQ